MEPCKKFREKAVPCTGATAGQSQAKRKKDCAPENKKVNIDAYNGWNCGGYPTSPYDSTQICEYASLNLSFVKAGYSLQSPGKWYETPYTLCDTVTLSAEFKSTELGYVYPDSVELQNLDPGLQILSVSITGTGAAVPLLPTSQPQVWLIGPSAMSAAGFSGGGFNNGAVFTLRVEFIPSCTFAGDTTLPDIVIFAHNFCNDSVSTNANKTMMSTFRMSSVQSNCTDCWSITKTADADTATVVTDTVTYTITVCNNSANAQTGVLSDMMQGGFVVTATTLAGSVTLNPMQCDTFTVSGYFTQYGSCFYNVATVTSPANTTWQDSVCVEVVSPCANTDTTFADSSYSGGGTLGAMSIYVAGRYYVNGTLVLNNCMVYVNAGGQITVQGGGNLILNNTTIQSCDTMWRGVTVLANGKTTLNGSTLRDANTGIYAVHQSQVEILQSKIYDCVTGLLIPAQAGNGYNSISLKVDGSSFKMQSPSFKPDYAGQPAHGAIPKAGIDVTNMIATIGDANLNEFEKLNTGIVAKSSILTVKRSKFTNIGYDMFYTEPYRGTAMVSVGMPTGDIHTGSLTVLPEAITYNTVDNCYRGIYVNKSALYADYIHILNVTQGVYGTQTTLLQTSMVSNCTITTSGTGIFWVNNPLAKAMMAIGNNITVNASVMPPGLAKRMSRGAIYAGETTLFKPVVYTLNNNNIQLSNAFYGIMNNAALNSKIKENMIRISQSSGNADVTGIELNSSYNANVSCNTIKGDYAGGSAGNTYSIYVTQSTRANISCNTADSTYRGIFFGGVSPQTNLKGNEMSNQFNGLYLNNLAIIGQQPHRGNVWYGPFTSFGAVNMAPVQLVPGSTFYVDSLLSSVYKPTVNISGWFQFNSGNTYYCWQKPTMCNNAPPALLSLDSLEIMIANGTLESEEYVDETRAITEEYLYRTLSEDSALWQEDSSYVTFMTENMGEPTEYLYNAEEYMRAAYSYDSVFVNLIDSAYSQTELFSDSINLIDEWQNINPDANADSMLQVWTYKIDFLNQTINNLKVQQEASINDNLANAELKNDYVVNAELPEMNTAFMNEVEINYIERGNDIQYLIDNFSDILAIAQQCPYAGGNAVIRARVWLSMINDSIDYNDNAICLQSGIYRISNDTTFENNKSEDIKIIPNPANDKVTVELLGIYEGICKIQIRNTLNEIVYGAVFNCKKQKHVIDVSKLRQGVYSISVNAKGKKSIINKLIISR